ncbi:hypothetical protein [Nonomuraea sp. JJY05]|uniref:hypothetical protein n=1 Tax=Nonomuraea sp. JJY05 TaxID=3350255 RepID=UPI00373F05B3
MTRLWACCTVHAPVGCGDSGQVQAPGAMLGEEQHIQPFEQHGFDHEESHAMIA